MGLIDQIGQAQLPKHLGPAVKAAVVLMVAGGDPNAMRCIQIGQRGNVVRLSGHIAIHQVPGQDDEIGLGRIGALDHLAHIKRVVDGAGVQIGNHRNAQAIEFARQFGQGQLLLTHCGHPQALNGPMAADQQHGAHHNQGVVWLPKDFGHPGVAQHLAQHSHRIAQHRHGPGTGDAGKQPTSGYLQISNGGIAHCCVANGPNEQRRQSPKNGGGDDGDGVIFFPCAQQRVP